MRIVEVTGGLGNQMFQYAFGKYLSKKYPNDDIKYDLDYYGLNNSIRKYSLKEAFNLDLIAASKKEIRAIRGYYQYDSRFIRKINSIFKGYGSAKCEIIENLDKSVEDNKKDSPSSTYYSGYWQSEKYFQNFRKEILSDFSFKITSSSAEMKKMCEEMEDSFSVALHVRLEDYLQGNNYLVYGNICTSDYYKEAIDIIIKEHPDAVFYLFTTDSHKALEMLPDSVDYRIVQYDGQRDYYDMYLMSRCKSNIIANSTFSWWGAWLNENNDKTVLCPSRWLNNHDAYNQYCDGWKIVNV